MRLSIKDVLILDLDCPEATSGPADIEIVDGRIARPSALLWSLPKKAARDRGRSRTVRRYAGPAL
jgi:hypothetical protein